jgi:hypothetical protein
MIVKKAALAFRKGADTYSSIHLDTHSRRRLHVGMFDSD